LVKDILFKKVFLDKLPKYKHKDNCIDWGNTIGCKVEFIYGEINDEVTIIQYNKYTRKLKIKYNNDEFLINTGNFIYCKIGELLGIHTIKYKFNIGDIVEGIKIINQISITKNKSKQKGYDYQCLVCGNIDSINEYNLKRGTGCSVCSGKKVLRGYNDLWTTHPHIAEMLKNKEKGFFLNSGSNKTEIFICPNCSYEKSIHIYSIVKQGFGCNVCSDGISYPEKFIISLLKQLNINSILQLSKNNFDWCNDYKYDFYINDKNYIIETHGGQHYEENTGIWNSLSDIQNNDEQKEILAKLNGINNYTVLDCRKSEMEWIINSIMQSDLPNLLNFKKEDINWLKCHEYACSSLVKVACDYWNNGIKSTKEIAELIGLHYSSIIKYLKQGNTLGWCNYNAKQIMKMNGYNSSQKRKIKVICLNTMEIFNSLIDAEKYYNIKNIWNCINGNKQSAGKHPETGEKLVWMYYDEYIEQQQNNYYEVIV